MIAMTIWILLTAGIFAWNGLGQEPFIGVRFTDPPVNGGWLALAATAYAVVRFFWRRRKNPKR